MIRALLVSALSGYVALSYEILWYRAYSFVSGGSAMAFPLMLGFYLLGLAFGAAAARPLCRERARVWQGGLFILGANVLGLLVVPGLTWLVTRGVDWQSTLPLVALATVSLGTVFPLVSDWAVPPGRRAGIRPR